jgi:hypothetical protein
MSDIERDSNAVDRRAIAVRIKEEGGLLKKGIRDSRPYIASGSKQYYRTAKSNLTSRLANERRNHLKEQKE